MERRDIIQTDAGETVFGRLRERIAWLEKQYMERNREIPGNISGIEGARVRVVTVMCHSVNLGGRDQ